MDKKLDVSKFFTKENEEKGVEFSFIIDGEKTGIKALVVGANSNIAEKANDEYSKARSKALEVEDIEKRNNLIEKAFAKKCAAFTLKLTTEDDKELYIKDKVLQKEDYEDFYLNAPLFEQQMIMFVSKTENFLEKKKND